MKNVNKALLTPEILQEYVDINPLETWEHFRDERREGYQQIKQQLTNDQRGLCAYCEIDLHIDAQRGLDDFRVEHFIPKKPHNPPPNHALDWKNLLAVCTGGNTMGLEINTRFTSPDHSCDVPKANHDWTGDILNPLNIPSSPRLFKFDESTGDIMVDAMTCPSALQHRASETIRLLRLSAPRLNNLRLPVFEMLNEKIQELATQGLEIEEAANLLAEELIPEKSEMHLPAFFTSIRWYLGEAAESRLQSINYAG